MPMLGEDAFVGKVKTKSFQSSQRAWRYVKVFSMWQTSRRSQKQAWQEGLSHACPVCPAAVVVREKEWGRPGTGVPAPVLSTTNQPTREGHVHRRERERDKPEWEKARQGNVANSGAGREGREIEVGGRTTG